MDSARRGAGPGKKYGKGSVLSINVSAVLCIVIASMLVVLLVCIVIMVGLASKAGTESLAHALAQ